MVKEKTEKKTKKTVRKKKVIKKPEAKKPKKSVSKKKVEKKEIKAGSGKYFEAVGRRKTAVARVRIFTRGEKVILVNNKPFDVYFPMRKLQEVVKSPLVKMDCLGKFRITVILKGGGFNGQAEALRHGITRALVKYKSDFRQDLKKAGYLTRDPRMRERKKFGLKRARRAPQWQKR